MLYATEDLPSHDPVMYAIFQHVL